MESFSLLIADDHPMFRAALQGILAQSEIGESCVFYEADSLASIHQSLQAHRDIDLLLLDLHMPGAKGLSGLANLRGCYPSLPILVISGSDLPYVIRQARELGALGFISKTETPGNMSASVSAVLQGNESFPEIHQEPYSTGLDAEVSELASRLAELTPHQFRVYGMVAEGMLNKQIAYELDIALPTAKSHVTAIFRKLKVRDRKQLIVLSKKLDVEQSG